MPNLKIYVDESRYGELRARLAGLLPELRDMLCAGLEATPEACQLAVLPVLALPGQPGVNAELHILPRPGRSRERLERLGAQIRDRLARDTGLGVAIRIAQLDADSYVALK